MRHPTCREVIVNHLDEYLEGTLSRGIVNSLEWHLSNCPACVAYLNTYKRTQEFTRRMGEVAMSESTKTHLRQFLLERLLCQERKGITGVTER